MVRMLKLEDLQIWFYKSITSKPGVEIGANQADLLERYQIEGDPIQSIVKSTDTLGAADRLSIYRNAYFLRLVGVFEAEYPVLKSVLGDELFNNFALLFLEQFPPQSYTLHDLSARFVEFLIQSQPEEQRNELWPSFLIELAGLERLFQEIYMAKGIESNSNMIGFLQDHSSLHEEWDQMTEKGFTRLFSGIFPVHKYLMEVRRGIDTEIPMPKETFLIIYRKDYKVVMHEITKEKFNELAVIGKKASS